jgi:lysozyme family protein
MPAFDFNDLRSGYRADWARMVIDAGRTADVDRAARRILAVKARYLTVSAATGVPWFVIGLLHLREADLSFTTHLHNGDSLKRRTVHVPAGRPKRPDPPYGWEESAIDALRFDGLAKVDDWTLERIAFQSESYNGFGPRNRGRASGYLWAGSNVYTGGKYVEDGVWDGAVRDRQLGVMPVLKRLAELDADVSAALEWGGVAERRPITMKDAAASAPVVQLVTKASAAGGSGAAIAATGHSWMAAAIVAGVVAVLVIAGIWTLVRRQARLSAAAASLED